MRIGLKLLCLVMAFGTAAPLSGQSWNTGKIDQLHQWTFRMHRGADSLGYTRFEVRRIGSQILVSEDSRVPGFREDMYLYLNDSTLEADSLLITGRLSGFPIESKFRWQDDTVRGYMNFPKSARRGTVSLKKALPDGTIPRLASFVLSPFLQELAEGMNFTYAQFSGLDGEVRTVKARVIGSESIVLGGKSIEAYRLELTGGVADQVIFIDKAKPRIVKITLKNIDWVYELIDL